MFEELLRVWQDPHARHAALVHAPLVLGGLGLAPAAWLAATRFRSCPARTVCVAWFLLAAVVAFLAENAGEDAAMTVARNGVSLTQVEAGALDDHEEAGEKVPILLAGVGVLALVTGIRKPRAVQLAAGVLTVAGAAVATGLVMYTGHKGGLLVYTHGLGVPERR